MDNSFFQQYSETLQQTLRTQDWSGVEKLARAMRSAWENNRRVFLCGNGGSAGNAIHLANDFLYGVNKEEGIGLRITALPANAAVLTCLANDISYEDIFSQQLLVDADRGDILIVLSGSGNSPNIVKAVETGRDLGMQTFGLLGYSGGRCLELVDVAIHFPINDMQIAEDMQLVVGHMLMRALCANPVRKNPRVAGAPK